jgi:hypothetical protein
MSDDRFISRYLRSRRLRGRTEPGPPAPFVVGVGRSGTTLLRLMLDAHPKMAMPPETHFFESVIEASGRLRFGPQQALAAIKEDPRRRWNDFGITEDELLDRFESIDRFNVSDALRAFYELYAEKQGKPRWGDKTPTYVKTMRRIKRVLPEARFIHVIRDGRDVTLSNNKRMMERGHRDPVPAARSARRWRNRIEKARADGPHLGEYLEIRYEDLVADTPSAMRRLYSDLGIPADEADLSRVVAKHSWKNVPEEEKGAGKVYRKGTPGGWREDLTPGQAAIVEEMAAPIIREFYAGREDTGG